MSRENWWLDFVEGDIDEATRAEMKTLLRHSPAEQEVVKSIQNTKAMLLEHDPLAARLSTNDQLDFLHDRIMAGIEDKVIKAPPRYRLRAHHHRWVKATAKGLAVLALILLTGPFVSNKSRNTQGDISKQMAEQGQMNPEDLSVLMAYQTADDFFVDVASQSLDHLNKEQLESFLKVTTR
jgi:hypothetical protein